MVSEEHASWLLASIVTLASIANMIGSIISGICADVTMLHVPIIIIGNFFWGSTIITRTFFVSKKVSFILLYSFITIAGKFFYSFVDVPYSALIPALFNKDSYGTVSGAFGFTFLIGFAVGVAGMGLVYQTLGDFKLCLITFIVINALSLSLIPFMFRHKPRRRKVFDKDGKSFKKRKSQKDSRLLRSEVRINDDEDDQNISSRPLLIDSSDNESSSSIDQHDTRSPMEGIGNIAKDENTFDSPLASSTSFRAASSSPSSLSMYDRLSNMIRPFIKPFTHRNYTLIVLVRFWMYMSLSTTQTYTLYFLQDMVDTNDEGGYSVFFIGAVSTSEQALAVFSLTVLFTALFSSVTVGWLSDRYSEKKYYVFLSCVLGSLLQIIVVFTHNFSVMLICGLLLGTCIGAFISIDLALANEVLPDKSEAGKDLAIYASAKTLPTLIGTPISGFLLTLGNMIHPPLIPKNLFGYYVIYSLSSLCALASGISVLFVESRRTVKEIRATLVME